MSLQKLPVRLKKEPLIDAVFEVRFSSKVPVSGIFPGFLYARLQGEKILQETPITQIPKAVRDSDPSLQYAPLSSVVHRGSVINVSDRSVSVGCKAPYPGWASFKPAIIEVITMLNELGVVDVVDRYSMKYVDLIPAPPETSQASLVNVDIAIAGHKLTQENFLVRMEVPQDNVLNVVQIVSDAKVILTDPSRANSSSEGLIVDVDSIVKVAGAPLSSLLEGFPEKLDALHLTNKKMFFDCLRPKTLDALEPEYE